MIGDKQGKLGIFRKDNLSLVLKFQLSTSAISNIHASMPVDKKEKGLPIILNLFVKSLTSNATNVKAHFAFFSQICPEII